MNCGGSSRLDEPNTISLCSFVVNLWQARNSDRVAPPTINTKMRRPILLKSLDAHLRKYNLEYPSSELLARAHVADLLDLIE
nr:hypothetical protein Iba_scaffold49456CG0010 [Ipomoea batatas]